MEDATNRTLVLNRAILVNSSECSVEVCYDVISLQNSGGGWEFQNRQTDQPSNRFQITAGLSNRTINLYKTNDIKNKKTYQSDIGKRTFSFKYYIFKQL